jgi:hypothetical protein
LRRSFLFLLPPPRLVVDTGRLIVAFDVVGRLIVALVVVGVLDVVVGALEVVGVLDVVVDALDVVGAGLDVVCGSVSGLCPAAACAVSCADVSHAAVVAVGILLHLLEK